MPVVQIKHKIKYMYVLQRSARRKTIDISMLTASGDYIEYTLDFKKDCITQYTAMRFKSLFSALQLTEESDVMFNELLSESHPMRQYLSLVRQHVQFKFSSVKLKTAVKRVQDFYLHRICKPQLMRAWMLAIEKNRCSWITQDIEWRLQNCSAAIARRIRQLRLMLLYMDIKNYLYAIVSKSKAKKMMK